MLLLVVELALERAVGDRGADLREQLRRVAEAGRGAGDREPDPWAQLETTAFPEDARDGAVGMGVLGPDPVEGRDHPARREHAPLVVEDVALDLGPLER